MDRPIVVNSLLCFIHNFRSHPMLDTLSQKYFSKALYDAAHNTLSEILNDQQMKESDEEELQDFTLIELFDKVISTLDPIPVFVAADLSTLPMVLINDQNPSKNVIDEIHQLRFYIQSTFSPDNRNKKLPSGYYSALSNNIIGVTNNEKESTIPSVETVSALSCEEDHTSPINLSTTSRRVSPMLREQKIDDSQMLLSSTKNNNGELKSSPPVGVTPPRKLRKHAPYRLDKAVRKLTDRLEATKDTGSPTKSSSSPPLLSSSSSGIKVKIEEDEMPNRSTSAESCLPHDSSSSNTSSTTTVQEESAGVAAIIPPPSDELPSFLNPPTLNGRFDPIAFMMLKNLATNHQALKNHAIQSARSNVSDSISVDATSIDEMDDDDKMSNESSPTPSDSSNGKDYKSENHSGKPFTCTQPNCTKSFANKFLLKKHQFIHTGLRPHVCPFCHKRFNRKDNLLRHKKTHLQNALLPTNDGRRRHHALLAPPPPQLTAAAAAATTASGNFDPLALLKISHTQNNNDESEGVNFDAISP